MTESFWTRGARKILQATFCIGLLTILTCFAPAQPTCDVNGDGIVDVLDVQLITNWAALGKCPSTVNVIGPGLCNELAQRLVTKAALGLGCHFVSLSWTASSSRGVTGYTIYRGTRPNDPSPVRLNSVPVAGTSYRDVTVRSGRMYYFTVRAVSGGGESGASNEARVSVP
jgi:Fibronectin type III domain